MREYEFYYTEDGSIGLYSYCDNDVYHSKFGAISEAWEKFIYPSNILSKLNEQEKINVLDICYGIGYNTKALISNIIYKDEQYLKNNSFSNKIKIFIRKIINIDSIYENNMYKSKKKLLSHDDTIYDDNTKDNISIKIKKYIIRLLHLEKEKKLSTISIDCLDINEELVKISPLLKTVITPQEFFMKLIPHIFSCFDIYWKIVNFLSDVSFIFLPKNNKNINDLLNLKFKNKYKSVKNEKRIHKLVNYMIVDSLVTKYGNQLLDKNIENIIQDKSKKRFLDKSMLLYAKFKLKKPIYFIKYKLLSSFLHNIYYDHLSKRYKKINSKDLSNLFELHFYVNDARKTILDLNKQYDLVFLDAFTYSKSPELWSVDFFAEIYKRLSDTGMLLTYSNSVLVRNSLLLNNFFVGKIYDEKSKKFIGTVATKNKNLIKYPLSNYEIGLCNTKAGIPYHDPGLNFTKDKILFDRENEFNNSELISSSQYSRIAKKNLE